jgi:hypothetical protein
MIKPIVANKDLSSDPNPQPGGQYEAAVIKIYFCPFLKKI